MNDITIYHNPACSKSRETLALLQQKGFEPTVIEYLKTPPKRETLTALIQTMGVEVRDVMRSNEAPYTELGLADPTLSDEALIDFMVEHPILMNRPIVATPLGVRLCRPVETVLEILPPKS